MYSSHLLRVALVAVSFAMVGCGPQAEVAEKKDSVDHNEHAMPTTYAESVTDLRELLTEIETHLASGELNEVDHMVHDVGDITKGVPKMAESAGFDENKLGEIKAESDRLFATVMKIHEGMDAHSGEAKSFDYSTVKSDVTESLYKLESYVEKKPTE